MVTNSLAANIFAALITGSIVGVTGAMTADHVWSLGQAEAASLEAQSQATANPEKAEGTQAVPRQGLASMIYAEALQQGNWDEVVHRTAWMQARLDFARTQGGAVAEDEAYRTLVARLGSPETAYAQLSPEGVEDRYIFHPGATFSFAGVDEGRDDLSSPAAARSWIHVRFEAPQSALRDDRGLPIRTIRVGVNTDGAGRVLKANVVGNLEIDWDSVRYDW